MGLHSTLGASSHIRTETGNFSDSLELNANNKHSQRETKCQVLMSTVTATTNEDVSKTWDKTKKETDSALPSKVCCTAVPKFADQEEVGIQSQETGTTTICVPAGLWISSDICSLIY